MTCMHCRFYKDYIQIYQGSLHSIDSSSTTAQKVKQSITNINNPLVLLDSSNENATTKFSVISEDTMPTVHLSFQTSGACYVNCQNGLCHVYNY